MLERIVASIALALFKWLEGRMAKGSVAVDADVDRDRLVRAGDRLAEWLREDGARRGGKPPADGPRDAG